MTPRPHPGAALLAAALALGPVHATSLAAEPQAPPPAITHVALVEPGVLAIEVLAGEVVVPPRRPLPLPKDSPVPHREERWTSGNGSVIGFRVGPAADLLQPVETIIGTPWTGAATVEQPGNARVTLDGRPAPVRRIGRKSFPDHIARTGPWAFEAAQRHRIYLELASPPAPGARVRIDLPGLPTTDAVLDSTTTTTEGLRVCQVGFRPDDPAKTALFTLWRGSLGPSAWTPSRFEVLDAATGTVAFEGSATLHHDGSRPDTQTGIFGALAPVYVLDFSALRTPGRYRLHLPGVGCSHPFSIAGDAWERAFAIAAKGFYFQRNGIAHDRRFGPYQAPRAFHQDDGVVVHASTTGIMDSGNGLNALGTDEGNFRNLVAGATDTVVSPTWGGYKDAGDWDSRIQHLDATRQLLELLELFPEQCAGVRLGLPESDNRLPDLLHEALWNLDHYRRLQTADGGVRGGVEQEEHPNYGETSWLNSLRNFTYAPDPWSSWLYAATAAQASSVLQRYDAAAAQGYLDSARRAYAWAAAEVVRLARPSLPHQVRDARNLAAAWLWRTTREEAYAGDCRTSSSWLAGGPVDQWKSASQGEACALAARGTLMPDVTEPARKALLAVADAVVAQTRKTSLRNAFLNDYSWWGYGAQVSAPGLPYLVWAHTITGDDRYLVALLHGAGFGTGLNPTGTVYTSGVGTTPTKRPFMIDPRYSQQDYPPGITVYGPLSWKLEGTGTWFGVARRFMYPDGDQWPASETWFDAYWTIMMNEFTIHQSLGPTAHTWGYLAFRSALAR